MSELRAGADVIESGSGLGSADDARLIVAGALSAGLAIAVVGVRALNLIPLPVAVPVVAIPAAVGLRCLMMFAARRASTSRRAQVLQVVSIVGLTVAVGNLALGLPTLLAAGGPGPFLADVAGTVYAVALLAVAVSMTRTLTWRAALGLFFVGFFGVTALAALVGRPVVSALGGQNPFASVVWAPVTEELLKGLPVAIVLWLATRNRSMRPSIGDAVLMGFMVGAGFALYEDALYGRATAAGWLGAAPFSLLIPSAHPASAFGADFLVGGHVVYTGLVSLGLGVGLLYGRRLGWARAAIPVALGVAILEHATVNQMALLGLFDTVPAWVGAASALTLGGHLSFILLVAGLGAMTFLEARALRAGFDAADVLRPVRLILVAPASAARRAAALAGLQAAGEAGGR